MKKITMFLCTAFLMMGSFWAMASPADLSALSFDSPPAASVAMAVTDNPALLGALDSISMVDDLTMTDNSKVPDPVVLSVDDNWGFGTSVDFVPLNIMVTHTLSETEYSLYRTRASPLSLSTSRSCTELPQSYVT